MPNNITLAQQFVPVLDEIYKLASLTSSLDGSPELAREGANAGELIIPMLEMQGLGDYSRNAGYAGGDVTLTNATVKCNYERGRMFTVDAMDDQETANIAFGRLAGEFIRTKVVPEIDAYRYSTLAALAAGLCLGLELEAMTAVMPNLHGVKGRVEVVPVPRAYTVLIDYAHTPNALENILTTARDFTAGRLICLFGCGGDRDRSKRAKMGAIASELADYVVVTSDNPRTEPPEAIIDDILKGMGQETPCAVEPDRRKAIRLALAQAGPGDTVLLAGKGHETEQEIDGVLFNEDLPLVDVGEHPA